jgi:hypothetical protein
MNNVAPNPRFFLNESLMSPKIDIAWLSQREVRKGYMLLSHTPGATKDSQWLPLGVMKR